MKPERIRKYPDGPRMRPFYPEELLEMKLGVLKGMQQKGYDYPVRKLSKLGGSFKVTLPLQVRNYLELRDGDWLSFGSTPCPGVAGFVKVTASRAELFRAEERKGFRALSRKVRSARGSLRVCIPPAIRRLLGADAGDALIFSMKSEVSAVIFAAVKGSDKSTGSRRSG